MSKPLESKHSNEELESDSSFNTSTFLFDTITTSYYSLPSFSHKDLVRIEDYVRFENSDSSSQRIMEKHEKEQNPSTSVLSKNLKQALKNKLETASFKLPDGSLSKKEVDLNKFSSPRNFKQDRTQSSSTLLLPSPARMIHSNSYSDDFDESESDNSSESDEDLSVTKETESYNFCKLSTILEEAESSQNTTKLPKEDSIGELFSVMYDINWSSGRSKKQAGFIDKLGTLSENEYTLDCNESEIDDHLESFCAGMLADRSGSPILVKKEKKEENEESSDFDGFLTKYAEYLKPELREMLKNQEKNSRDSLCDNDEKMNERSHTGMCANRGIEERRVERNNSKEINAEFSVKRSKIIQKEQGCVGRIKISNADIKEIMIPKIVLQTENNEIIELSLELTKDNDVMGTSIQSFTHAIPQLSLTQSPRVITCPLKPFSELRKMFSPKTKSPRKVLSSYSQAREIYSPKITKPPRKGTSSFSQNREKFSPKFQKPSSTVSPRSKIPLPLSKSIQERMNNQQENFLPTYPRQRVANLRKLFSPGKKSG